MQTDRMISIRDLFAAVLTEQFNGSRDDVPLRQADALLADPRVKAIIDLASRHVDRYDTPEVWALLADWRDG